MEAQQGPNMFGKEKSKDDSLGHSKTFDWIKSGPPKSGHITDKMASIATHPTKLKK